MTQKEQALNDTKNRFTNLLDGCVRSGVSVSEIIRYYESRLNNQPAPETKRSSGIVDNFIEDYLKHMENEDGGF
jgi:hypothetical protein